MLPTQSNLRLKSYRIRHSILSLLFYTESRNEDSILCFSINTMATFSDTFDTAIAAPWSTYTSGGTVSRSSGNQLTSISGSGNATAYLSGILADASVDDVDMTCTVVGQTGTYNESSVGLFGKNMPINQGIYFLSSKYSGGSYRLYASGPDGTADWTASVTQGHTFTLRMVWTASTRNCKVYINGNLIFDVTVATGNIPTGENYLFWQRAALWTATSITLGQVDITYDAEENYEQSLTVTAQASSLLGDQKSFLRSLTVTADATTSMIRSIGKNISVTAQAITSIVRQITKELTVTASGTPILTAGLLYVKELAVTAEATASIVKQQVTLVTLTVTAEATASLERIKNLSAELVATAQASTSIDRLKTLSKALTATAQATAEVIQSGVTISRELVVTASATVTMSLGKSLSRALTATASAVTSLLADFGYVDKYPENDATYQDKYPEN